MYWLGAESHNIFRKVSQKVSTNVVRTILNTKRHGIYWQGSESHNPYTLSSSSQPLRIATGEHNSYVSSHTPSCTKV